MGRYTWLLRHAPLSPEKVERFERDKIQDVTPDTRREAAPPLYRCRVCGLERDDGSYCPRCLADTMVRVATRGHDRDG